MQHAIFVLGFAFALCLGTAATADRVTATTGSDAFFAGAVLNENLATSGDTFVAARKADVNGRAGGDLHVSGYDVQVDAETTGDLYAFGATVKLGGAVGDNVTAGGFTVRLDPDAEIQGNARLFGNSVTINGPVGGALTVTARDVVLNAPVSADARIAAQTITFGPNAKIAGTLTYSTQDRMAVPERVVASDRVVFEALSARDEWEAWRKDMPVFPTFASILSGFIISLLFFVALGAVTLGFMPKPLEAMRQRIATAPGQELLLGVIGLSMLFGAVPVTGLTIVGLPFVPIAVLAIIVAWTLGYALGAYSVAMRVWAGLGGEAEPSNVQRLLVFAGAIIFVALLNFIPFVGWVANYTLVLLGIGAMAHAVFQKLVGTTDPVLQEDLTPIED